MKLSLLITFFLVISSSASAESYVNPWASKMAQRKLALDTPDKLIRALFDAVRDVDALVAASYFDRLELVVAGAGQDNAEVLQRKLSVSVKEGDQVGPLLSRFCVDQGISLTIQDKTVIIHPDTGLLKQEARDWFIDIAGAPEISRDLSAILDKDQRSGHLKKYIYAHYEPVRDFKVLTSAGNGRMALVRCSVVDYLAIARLLKSD